MKAFVSWFKKKKKEKSDTVKWKEVKWKSEVKRKVKEGLREWKVKYRFGKWKEQENIEEKIEGYRGRRGWL